MRVLLPPLHKTASGDHLKLSIYDHVRRCGYAAQTEQPIGAGLGGGTQRVDVLVLLLDDYHQAPVSAKWQGTAGTAKEKVPYEVIKLLAAIRASNGLFPYAYLVIGGTEWGTLGTFYLNGGLNAYIPGAEYVRIMTLTQFMDCANKRQL